MPKQEKKEIVLIDEEGREWVRAALTAPAIKRIIRLYKAQEIWLTERAAA